MTRPKTIFKGEGFAPMFIKKQNKKTGKIEKDSEPIYREQALAIGNEIIASIRNADRNVRVSFAGSIRRESALIHDIDILVSPFSKSIQDLISMWENSDILWSGTDKISTIIETGILTHSKIQIDIRFVPPQSWGPALQYFTGSREHNISLRSIAKHRNLTLNENGLFDLLGKRLDDGTEGGIYKALGLRWLPPKYRNEYIHRQPKPSWCIDHQIKDFCKRERHLLKKGASKTSDLFIRKDANRTEAGTPGAPRPSNAVEPLCESGSSENGESARSGFLAPTGGTSLKNPNVLTDIAQDKPQDDLP